MSATPEHRTAIVVGGGPAGLPMAAVLGGWHPYYRDSAMLRQRYPQLVQLLAQHTGSLLSLEFTDLLRAGIPPADMFRLLHHPRQLFEGLDQIALEFRRNDAVDCLLLTQEEVGGLWNNVPEKLLTLSPGQWMEFAFHPLAQYAQETGQSFDVNELLIKQRIIDYYHQIPKRFDVEQSIHTWERVTRIEPHPEGFLVTAADVSAWRDKDPVALRRPAFPQSADAVEQSHPVHLPLRGLRRRPTR